MGRPVGTFGELGQALLAAAADAPGTALDLAHRARVARGMARYTASRLVARGALVVVRPGRPAVLGLPSIDRTDPFAALAAAWHSSR